jgi:hypothetical protein
VVVLAENNWSLRSSQGLPVSVRNAVETLGNKMLPLISSIAHYIKMSSLSSFKLKY